MTTASRPYLAALDRRRPAIPVILRVGIDLPRREQQLGDTASNGAENGGSGLGDVVGKALSRILKVVIKDIGVTAGGDVGVE